jgi:general secretion pathway protein M
MKFASTLAPLRARWAALDSRERTLVITAASVVSVALLWWIGVAPALKTLREADNQQRALAAQVQKMQSLQAQAQAIQSQPKISRDDAMRALESSVKGLGPTAQLNVAGDRATVTLRNTAADALARWLSQARVNARAIPSEARLTRSAATSAGPATWDGTVVLSLPQQQ